MVYYLACDMRGCALSMFSLVSIIPNNIWFKGTLDVN